MTKNQRVTNITRGYSLKLGQAIHAVDICSAAWVVYGSTIRDLTLAEAIAARNRQAAQRESLPFAELPGLMWQPPATAIAAAQNEYRLANEANRFCEASR